MITVARLLVLGIMLAMAFVVIFAGAIPKARANDQPFVSNQLQTWYEQVAQDVCSELPHSYRVKIVRHTAEYSIIEITDNRPDEILGRPHIEPGTRFQIESKGIVWNKGNPTEYDLLFTNSSGSAACLVPKSTT